MWNILTEAVQDCLTKSHYKVLISVANPKRIDCIQSILDEIIEEKKLQEFITSYRFNHNHDIVFNNCSKIEISTCNESRKAYKVHTLVVDDDIDYEVSRTILYPCMIPYHYWNYQTATIYDNPKRYEIKFILVETKKGETIICPIKTH